MSLAASAKIKHDARADDALVERPGKMIVLSHVIKLNARSLVHSLCDAGVVSRSAPGLDGRVVKLLPHHEGRILFDRTLEGDAISISLGERSSRRCLFPSQFRPDPVREQKMMKRGSVESDLTEDSVFMTDSAELRVRMKVKISWRKRDPL